MHFDLLHYLKRICVLVLGTLLILGASLMLVGALMVWAATERWPWTEGKLLRFESQSSGSRRKPVKLELEYEYSVDGQAFTGAELSPVIPSGEMTRWYAEKKKREFRAGENVRVTYDPTNPTRSFLETPDLLLDVLLHPISIGCLGAWMVFLFVQTRRRKVPAEVAALLENRFAEGWDWQPVFESIIDREYVTLDGVTSYSKLGGLFAGWTSCRVALVASPGEFAVVSGPYTRRGFASCVLTMVLEMSLSQVWLPLAHGMIFLYEVLRRRRTWKQFQERRLGELLLGRRGTESVSIDDAIVYGFDTRTRRLWFRVPGRRIDEFVQLTDEDSHVAEFIAFVGLMQRAVPADLLASKASGLGSSSPS